jgi:hypothetical protein
MINDSKPELRSNPLVTVIGAVAIGAIGAALLPKTARENKHLGPIGKHMRGRARNAAAAAKDVGKEHLDNLGINREAAATQLRDLAAKLGKAASAAGTAAAEAARKT